MDDSHFYSYLTGGAAGSAAGYIAAKTLNGAPMTWAAYGSVIGILWAWNSRTRTARLSDEFEQIVKAPTGLLAAFKG